MDHVIRIEKPKPGCTLGDLRELVRASDGAPDDSPLRMQMYVGGKIKSIEVQLYEAER